MCENRAHDYEQGDAVDSESRTVTRQVADNGNVALRSLDIRNLLAARRARARFFNDELFSDPAWEILLAAYAARLDQQRRSVTDISSASAVPHSTALRWIQKLETDGLLIRKPDPLDLRRYWLEISDDGAEAMQKYLSSVWSFIRPI